MNKQEFEQITKSTITDHDYKRVESIYMNAGEMDKYGFCKAIKAVKGDALELVEVLSKEVTSQRNHSGILDGKIEMLEHDLAEQREIKELRTRELEELRNYTCDLEDKSSELAEKTEALALALLTAGLDEQAIAILGHSFIIGLKCANDIEINQADRNYLAQTLKR